MHVQNCLLMTVNAINSLLVEGRSFRPYILFISPIKVEALPMSADEATEMERVKFVMKGGVVFRNDLK
jgi:hypothetical protein